MIMFMDPKETIKGVDHCLDSQFWHACAGGMVQMPLVNAKVYYLAQGHIEHSGFNLDFRNFPRIPPYVLCRVQTIKYLADDESDEVYVKLRLVPIGNQPDYGHGDGDGEVQVNKPASFAKTLTQSDANNGGGFSVPRYCAETIFPRLDYTSDPPVQNIVAKDVHGEPWKFRHIYRGTPRRHLLTTGWSAFVNAKKLIAGDSIVFLRAENGDLCVGIRRVKRVFGGIYDSYSGWNPASTNMQYGGGFLREGDQNNKTTGNGDGNATVCMFGMAKVKVGSVFEAANNATNGLPYEVTYHPRAGSPEFVVKAALIKAALQIRWCSGMRFKMPFETEDSSRISWFMGTVSSVQVSDPVHWPDSPWRLLEVTWDEPDLLQNVKRVSPWLVELVSNMPSIHLSRFSPPRKKFRVPQHQDFSLDGPGNIPGASNLLPENYPAGMQGARHAQFGLSLSDIHVSNLLDPGITPSTSLRKLENISCLLTIGNSKKPDDTTKAHELRLFGKQIVPEQQMSLSISGCYTLSADTKTGITDCNSGEPNREEMYLELDTGHCKVFLESEDVVRTLDLSLLGSYDDLHSKLGIMYGIDSCEIHNRVVYRDGGANISKQIGDEPFSEFAKRAKRLTILMDSSSDNVCRSINAGVE